MRAATECISVRDVSIRLRPVQELCTVPIEPEHSDDDDQFKISNIITFQSRGLYKCQIHLDLEDLSLSSLVGGEALRISESGEEPEPVKAEQSTWIWIFAAVSHHQHYRDHHIISSSLSFPKLWLSRFLIFLYLAKVPPPSFFSRSTTPVPGNGISPGLPDHDDEEEDDDDNNEYDGNGKKFAKKKNWIGQRH